MRLVALDVETTGLCDNDEIVEFAWAELCDDLNVLRRHRSLIDPQRTIPANASGVHGITDRDVELQPTMREYLESFAHPFTSPVIIAAHNAPFDKRFVSRHFDVIGSLCTLRLARKLYPDAPNHKLATLKYYLDLPVDEAFHSAEGDVSVLVALLNKMSDDTGLDAAGLYDLSNEPSLLTKMPFGKHKGLALKDLPPCYVRWLLEQDISEDLRHSLVQLCC